MVGPKEKQPTFTGREQRRGVYILPLVVPGVFKLRWQPPAQGPDVDPSVVAGAFQREAEQGAAVEEPADVSGYEADDDETAAAVQNDFNFDWAAYHRAFGDTPFDEAVTAMFVAYAALYKRMAGYAGAVFPKKMTLAEAAAIQEQATSFVNNMVTPLLGPINSTKIHRLLCHVFEAIRDHGSLRNSNTAVNECKHKEDKAHYVRTNKDPKTFTRQVVRHAQGSRIVKTRLDRHDEATKAARRVARAAAAPAAAASDSGGRFFSSGSDTSTTDESGCDGVSTGSSTDSGDSSDGAANRLLGVSGTAASGSHPAPPKRLYHLDRTTVSAITARPGLAGAATLLHMDPDAVVRVTKSMTIDARFDCGTVCKQIVRGTPDYRGAPWFDAVLFHAGKRTSRVRAGEVRALVRKPEGDVALVVEMVPADATQGCPLERHGCFRLRWNFPDGAAECVARQVPLHRIRRLIHVVPDFKDLAERRGYEAKPASPESPPQDRREMRYYLNALYPWDAS